MATALQRGWLSPAGTQRGQQEQPTALRRPRTHSLITVKQGGHQNAYLFALFRSKAITTNNPSGFLEHLCMINKRGPGRKEREMK